jgi:hypothetical protein
VGDRRHTIDASTGGLIGSGSHTVSQPAPFVLRPVRAPRSEGGPLDDEVTPTMATRTRLHRSILWSGAVWLASFPLMLLYLAVIGMIGRMLGITFGSAEDAGTERVLNYVYMALVLGTLGIAFVIALRGWRRHGLRLALAVAVLSAVTGLLFLLVPVLL